MKVFEKCPICNTKLEDITDEDDFIIDWFCSKCCIGWELEDLEYYESVQKDLTVFI